MQLRKARRVRSFAGAALCGILISGGVGGLPALARPMPQEAAPADNLPLVMIFTPRQAGAKFSAKNDPNVALRVLLRDALRESGRYRAVSFQAGDPIVVRALREHTLAAADVVEPISTEAMQRIASAFGAKAFLSLDAALVQNTLTSQARLQQASGADQWSVAYDNKTVTSLVAGRKKMKFAEAVAVAADPLLIRLGVPSRAAGMVTGPPIPLVKPTKKDKADQAKAEKERIAQEKRREQDRIRAARAAQPDDAPVVPETPQKNASGKPDKKPDKKAADGGKAAPPTSNETPPRDSGFSAFTTDGAASRNIAPAKPDVAPPPALAAPDEQAAIARYQQAGDTANVIASLRRAINERPREILLRRQLIQAYSDRQMNDAALEETSRALQLMPEDAGLRRLYGDTLLAKGDLPNALQAYRDAIQRDPGDVAAQVAFADALLADSQFSEAQAAYQAAIKADPKSPLPHRRLANALLRRAVGDEKLYAASLNELKQSRALTPSADSALYREDYSALARLLESRLRDLLNELQNDFQARQQGKMTGDALKTALADLKARGEAAADYLDKLPPASGQDVTHAHYQQGAALLLQAISLFRDYAAKPDDATLTAMKGAQADAHRELTAGAKSLAAAKPNPSAKEN